MDSMLRFKLTHAVTDHDRKLMRRKGWNSYAIAHYLRGVQEVESAVDGGMDLRKALTHNFCGRLLDVCLKAVGLPESTDAEQRF